METNKIALADLVINVPDFFKQISFCKQCRQKLNLIQMKSMIFSEDNDNFIVCRNNMVGDNDEDDGQDSRQSRP